MTVGNIPSELRSREQWVVWRYEERGGKRTKVPFRVDGSGHASSTDPDTWSSFEDAVATASRFDGIGYVFSKDDPYAGVDFDACWDEGPTGWRDAWPWIGGLESYAEFTPSGQGVHTIVKASVGRGIKVGQPVDVEIYDRGRFFTFTGEHVRGTPETIEERQDVLEELIARIAPPKPPKPSPQPAAPVALDDRELVEKILHSGQGAKFASLWRGDWQTLYSSQSEADIALCSILAFWTQCDPGRMDGLFRSSGLMRDKWESARGDSTYGSQTIEKAIRGTSEVYDPDRFGPDRSHAERVFPANGNTPEHPVPPEDKRGVPVEVLTPRRGVTHREHPLPSPVPEIGKTPFELMTARAVCTLPDPPETDELLGSLVVRGHRIVIGAHTGEGKTTLALQLVRSIVAGEAFLDWQGAGKRALVVDAEQGLKTIKRRLREAGLADSEAVDYVRVPDGLALDSDKGHIAAVEAALAEGRYDVVLCDPLYKLHSGNSNDEREAVDLMRRFDAWRTRYHFALALPVHLRKPIPGERFSIHDVFGSSAYTRGAEVVLGLRRVSNGFAELHFFKDRDGDLPVGDKWGLIFDRESGFRRAPEDEVDSEEVLAERLLKFVRDSPGLSTNKVTDAVEGRKVTLTQILRNDDRFRSERRGSGSGDYWFESTGDLLDEESAA